MKNVHLQACLRFGGIAAGLTLVTLGAACGHGAPDASDPSSVPADGGASTVAIVNANTAAPAPNAASVGASDAGMTMASNASGSASASDGGLAIDQPAPDFDLTDQNGAHLALSQLHGHSVVLYFYPKDETPGCTKEACSFRDTWEQLDKEGVVLIGVSADSDESHRKFAANHKLPFHLVSDPQGALAAKYGVPFKAYTQRQTFLISPEGNLRRIYRSVNVDGHAQDIANALRT